MSVAAESQGLPQGFNDELADHAIDEVPPARPRPPSEAMDVTHQAHAERMAYDERHGIPALRARRGLDADNPRGSEPYPNRKPGGTQQEEAKAYADMTKRELVALLDEHKIPRPPDSAINRTKHDDLVRLAEENIAIGTLTGSEEPTPEQEARDARVAEITERLDAIGETDWDAISDDETEALAAEQQKLENELSDLTDGDGDA